MKQFCIYCERKSMAGDLWCQESYCTSDNLPYVFDYGESVGDMHISKCIAVLRSSAIYEATRYDADSSEHTKILLKVAHDGFEERLKKEAQFLHHLQKQNIFHPMLPKLLPAHVQATVDEFPYGKTVFNRQSKYYAVFEHSDGGIMREMLLKNPQPWYQHAAWIVMGLTDVIALLHNQGVLHLCLCPESVLIRTDSEMIPRPILMDLGSVTAPQDISTTWNSRYVPPAYIAPELLSYPRQPSRETDIYGLGLLFYELLAGQPAHEFRLKREKDILEAIQSSQIAPINRPDLRSEVLVIIDRAMGKNRPNRFSDAVSFGEKLMDAFPPVPAEKKPRKINWKLVGIIMLVFFFVVLLLVTAWYLAGEIA